MPVVQQGSINTTALIVPDLYVQIVAPQNLVLNGIPTNIIGVVGTASWGPVGTAVTVGSMADYARIFGAIQARKYDMGTQVATAVQQGANNFRCVRVTDGTDAAATSVIQTSCITLTSIYTGTTGNNLTWTIAAGSKASSYKITIALPGLAPEVFDNITGSGNALWVAMAAAINSGNSLVRGPSALITAAAGAGTASPTLASGTFSGGSDGVATLSASVLVGVDTASRKGMYSLRNQGCSIALLADADDSTQWVTQGSFGLSEGIYMILTAAAGIAVSNGSTGVVDLKGSTGIDTYAAKLMHGDWVWWQDQVNQVTRLVSPQGFVAGRLANLSPEQSSLNKPIYGVVATQKQGLVPQFSQSYSAAELSLLFAQGIDVISNPQPGGAFWGCRLGHNTSTNAATNGDNYTRLTNYVAYSLNAGMGQYVGQVINATLFQRVKATLSSFCQNMLQQGLLGTLDGSLPFSVICDTSNNPANRTALGYVQADVQIQYQAINEKFIVNVEGGQTVQVKRQTLPTGQVNG